jgi:type II secretion system protein N
VSADASAATGGGTTVIDRLRGGLAGLAGNAASGPVLWYAIFTLAVFVIALVATFPHELVVNQALRGATGRSAFLVETGGSRLGWTLGYGIDSLRVRLRDVEGDPLLLAEALELSPSRFGLLRGQPFPLGFAASLYGGTLRGVVDPRPASFAVNAMLEGVDLSRYTGARPWLDGRLRGRLEGTVALDGAGRGPAAAAGTVVVRIPGLTLEGAKIRGITVPDLHFTDVHANGTVKNARLEIDELVADGQEIVLRGDGNVLLRDPLDASVLSLALTITPAAGAPDGLKMMINMIPGTSGEGGARRVSVIGTLGRPTVR